MQSDEKCPKEIVTNPEHKEFKNVVGSMNPDLFSKIMRILNSKSRDNRACGVE